MNTRKNALVLSCLFECQSGKRLSQFQDKDYRIDVNRRPKMTHPGSHSAGNQLLGASLELEA